MRLQLKLLCAGLAMSAAACFAPPGPMERLNYAAYDMNAATRFGRMDVALDHVAKEAQNDFIERHAKWGRSLRIVDVELQGIRMLAKETAEVQLEIGWHRVDETTIRQSLVAQIWKSKPSGWKLDEEQRVAGSPGLFERPPKSQRERELPKAPDVDMGQL